MLLYNRQPVAGIGDGKHLPLLTRALPAGQVYAETAALKQQKRPTKNKTETKTKHEQVTLGWLIFQTNPQVSDKLPRHSII